jgi:predicted DsbA family dithiol-disulfide isomerase
VRRVPGAAATIVVDVWSDIACPWCYIGERNLESAIAAFCERHAGIEVAGTYHSFELSPDTPVDFEGSEADFLAGRLGLGRDEVDAMHERVAGIAAGAGLEYHFDRVRHTNTRRVHELLHHAAAAGRQAEAKERLMRAYFTEGRHLGRDDVLADVAALRPLLAGEHAAAVEADVQLAHRFGISGVPYFVLDRRYGVSGAQAPEVLAEALEHALQAQAAG